MLLQEDPGKVDYSSIGGLSDQIRCVWMLVYCDKERRSYVMGAAVLQGLPLLQETHPAAASSSKVAQATATVFGSIPTPALPPPPPPPTNLLPTAASCARLWSCR